MNAESNHPRRCLLLAIDSLHTHNQRWVKYSTKHANQGLGPYYWCHVGWERNDFHGYGWGVPQALRPFVENGDLTRWWTEGRNKKEMVDLFVQASRAL